MIHQTIYIRHQILQHQVSLSLHFLSPGSSFEWTGKAIYHHTVSPSTACKIDSSLCPLQQPAELSDVAGGGKSGVFLWLHTPRGCSSSLGGKGMRPGTTLGRCSHWCGAGKGAQQVLRSQGCLSPGVARWHQVDRWC